MFSSNNILKSYINHLTVSKNCIPQITDNTSIVLFVCDSGFYADYEYLLSIYFKIDEKFALSYDISFNKVCSYELYNAFNDLMDDVYKVMNSKECFITYTQKDKPLFDGIIKYINNIKKMPNDLIFHSAQLQSIV